MPAFNTPTLAQLIERAQGYGCVLESIDISDGDRTVTPVSYLSREEGGHTYEAILPGIEDHEHITPQKLNEIAADLDLPVDLLRPDYTLDS